MSSPSALLKVNYLVIRLLHFRNARGDLQEGHVYAKRLRDYAYLANILGGPAMNARLNTVLREKRAGLFS